MCKLYFSVIVILALGRVRQKDEWELKCSMECSRRHHLKTSKKKKGTREMVQCFRALAALAELQFPQDPVPFSDLRRHQTYMWAPIFINNILKIAFYC